MCGRYQAWVEDDALVEILEMEKQGAAERYLRQAEVFPGTVQPLLYGSLVRVRAHLSLWGVSLAPWGKKGTLINARAETAAEKTLFRPAFERDPSSQTKARRAAVVTSGYFEWQNGRKHHITDADGVPLFLGAVELDEPAASSAPNIGDPEEAPPRRHVILTTPAAGAPALIHDRMPLFLPRDRLDAWLYDPDFARYMLNHPFPLEMKVG
ncbi:MAG: SOS response-associated peptidase family protein [Clostridia bacterium]|nr:SOS response-associated peptidase family protein [Clostridia bacterium]